MYRNMKKSEPCVPVMHSGFTLVEMLISVTLVLLMMTLFASILSVATESVGTQQVISENDQKGRSLSTVIRNDFGSRTMRYPHAFYPGEESATSPTFKTEDRDGYVYISTNAPESYLDDKIQFTVHVNRLSNVESNVDYFGRAVLLADEQARASGGISDAAAALEGIATSPNQPDADDLDLSPNFTGSSPAAEISYFVRNGNLYRRVVLLREPLPIAGRTMETQPTSWRGNDFLQGDQSVGVRAHQFRRIDTSSTPATLSPLTNDYWLHFDYAAYAPVGASAGAIPMWANIVGTEALNNDSTGNGAAAIALGNPRYRWGFNSDSGRSREHTSLTTPFFIGGFTHAETSAGNFNWPQGPAHVEGNTGSILGNGNPFDISANAFTIDTSNGLVEAFDADTATGRGGARATEDLLLANVHQFKIEIWDERYGDFVVPGHGTSTTGTDGDYHIRRNLNADTVDNVYGYGPLGPYSPSAALPVLRQPHVFDTWHPAVGSVTAVDFDGDGNTNEISEVMAPYMPYLHYPPRQGDSPPGPSSNTMPDPPMLNKGYWAANTMYDVNDVVFASNAFGSTTILGWDADADGVFEWDEDSTAIPNQAFQIAYRCVAVTGSANSGASAPTFTETPGRRISDNEVIWEAIDNRRPLKSIRITIRFINQKSDLPKQMTLVIPMTDDP